MAKSLKVKNVMPRHEAIVDWEILNPGRNQGECAEELGMSECHISVIRHSDAFVAYRHERMLVHQGLVSETVVDKIENLASLSLGILTERFDSERNEVPLGGVKDTCEMALKALGFGGAANGPGGKNGGNVVNLIVGSSPALLEQARNNLAIANEAKAVTLDQPSDVKEEEPISAPEVLPPA